MRTSRLACAACIGLASAGVAFGQTQTVFITPTNLDTQARTVEIFVDGQVPETSVGSLAGLAIRLCWKPADALTVISDRTVMLEAGPGERWVGPQSVSACAEQDSAGLPMAWIDTNGTWPLEASFALASVGLRASEQDPDVSVSVHLWTESVGLAPDHSLESNSADMVFKGLRIFADGFD